jgi:hypothetical protein
MLLDVQHKLRGWVCLISATDDASLGESPDGLRALL